MRQVPKTPPVADCFCGARAKLIDWDFRDAWRVMCDKNHTLTGEFVTRHRAICRWNNEVEKRKAEINKKQPEDARAMARGGDMSHHGNGNGDGYGCGGED